MFRQSESYIEERLDKADLYFNQALLYARGQLKPPADTKPEQMVRSCITAGNDQFRKIERYIFQSEQDTKENKNYHQIIE
jgi:hypothetical protein